MLVYVRVVLSLHSLVHAAARCDARLLMRQQQSQSQGRSSSMAVRHDKHQQLQVDWIASMLSLQWSRILLPACSADDGIRPTIRRVNSQRALKN